MVVAGSLLALLGWSLPTHADESYVTAINYEKRGSFSTDGTAYWTPSKLRAAEFMPAPLPDPEVPSVLDDLERYGVGVENENDGEVGVDVAGHKPLVGTPTGLAERLFHGRPRAARGQRTKTDGLRAYDAGSLGAHYTSSRIIPLTADTAYPYSTVGKLYYTVPGKGDYQCSAAVIRPRVIVTAGHCVHSGKSSPGFHTNFLFIPSFRDGAAPYGAWTWERVWTTQTWTTSGGKVPNSADYAVIVLRDRPVNGVTRRIGDVTGWLGYQTNSLMPNHVTMLGYPVNLDYGTKMHQVHAGMFRATSSNCAEAGSDMTGGSSGGPWVQNFGVPASGQVGGAKPGMNRIVGVTSYGHTNPAPRAAGSSVLDSRFVGLINNACAVARNCN